MEIISEDILILIVDLEVVIVLHPIGGHMEAFLGLVITMAMEVGSLEEVMVDL